jgi:hypothetical protein
MDKDYITKLHVEVQERLRNVRLVFGNDNHRELALLMEKINKQISLVEKRNTAKNNETLQQLLTSAKWYLDKDCGNIK